MLGIDSIGGEGAGPERVSACAETPFYRLQTRHQRPPKSSLPSKLGHHPFSAAFGGLSWFEFINIMFNFIDLNSPNFGLSGFTNFKK